MYNLVLAISYIFSGFFMKYSDDEYDENNNKNKAIVLGIICGFFAGLATISNIDAAYIFIAILIGNLLAFKIDGLHHIVTFFVFILMCLLFGVPSLSIVILLICILSALFDEVGHELIGSASDNNILALFFEYRFIMKIAIFLLAVLGVLNLWSFVFFILFEISYELAGYVFKNLF